jgi:hypothetical protein
MDRWDIVGLGTLTVVLAYALVRVWFLWRQRYPGSRAPSASGNERDEALFAVDVMIYNRFVRLMSGIVTYEELEAQGLLHAMVTKPPRWTREETDRWRINLIANNPWAVRMVKERYHLYELCERAIGEADPPVSGETTSAPEDPPAEAPGPEGSEGPGPAEHSGG